MPSSPGLVGRLRDDELILGPGGQGLEESWDPDGSSSAATGATPISSPGISAHEVAGIVGIEVLAQPGIAGALQQIEQCLSRPTDNPAIEW